MNTAWKNKDCKEYAEGLRSAEALHKGEWWRWKLVPGGMGARDSGQVWELARLGAEDIALDMNNIFVHENDNWSNSSSEGSVGGVEEEWATCVVENAWFQY